MSERQRIVIPCDYGDIILNVPAGIRMTRVLSEVTRWCGSMLALIARDLDAIDLAERPKEEE